MAIFSKRVIPLDTIITPKISFSPACAFYLPFSNCSINQAMVYAGKEILIIFTEFSSMLIFLLPHSLWIYAVAWLVLTPIQILSAGPQVGIGRMVTPPWRSTFLWIRPRRCIYWISLGVVEIFQFWVLVLGRLPLLEGNLLGCAAAQTRSPYVTYINCLTSSSWGVCAGLLRGLTPHTLYFH